MASGLQNRISNLTCHSIYITLQSFERYLTLPNRFGLC
jgi:hypothetical protein